MQPRRMQGLIAATFTPMDSIGAVDLGPVAQIGKFLIASGVGGAFVNGSTGEGESLSVDERCAVAEAYVEACADAIPVIVQVGHNSVREAQRQADHARRIGATAIAAAAPSYFRPRSAEDLLVYLTQLAEAAPDLPLYYYHIPGMNHVDLDMVELLRLASARLPSLAGIKYSAINPCQMRACVDFAGGRYEIMFGSDEMLLYGLYSGAKAAVGSTYNFMAPLYLSVIDAFESGDLATACGMQARAVRIVEVLLRYPLIASLKACMTLRGFAVGPSRVPNPTLSDAECVELRAALEPLGFFASARDKVS